jgi:uncharacterized protein YdgA (DUF945 family)
MNKVAIAAAALLLIVLLGMPAVVGSITEARVRERVEAIDASPSAAAELISFERGWFRSTARIALKAENVAQLTDVAGTPFGVFSDLPIVVEFAHGPISVLDGVYFGWYRMVARPDAEAPSVAGLTETLAIPYLFEFRGNGPYLGGLRFDADAPPFALPVEEANVVFSGGTLAGTFTGQRLTGDAQVGSLDFMSPTGTLTVRGLLASVDSELRSQYVMPGTASFSIASISIGAPSPGSAPMFETSNLAVNSDVDIDAAGELLEMHLDYTVDSVRIEESELTAGTMAVTVRNLDVAAVEAYGALASDAAAAGADPSELTASLGPHLERALKAGPSVTLDPFRFRYDGEPFEGRVEVTTNPARLPPAGAVTLDNPLLLLSAVNTKADVRLSQPLAVELAKLSARMQLAADPTIPPEQVEYMADAQSGLMLTMLVGQGVLIEDGDAYRASFELMDGVMTLNGNPLPFGLQ